MTPQPNRAVVRAINKTLRSYRAAVYARFASGPLADGNGHRIIRARVHAGNMQVLLLSSGTWIHFGEADRLDAENEPLIRGGRA